MSTFRVSCCSGCLSQVQIPFPLSETEKKKWEEGVRGEPPALAGTREYEQSNRNW